MEVSQSHNFRQARLTSLSYTLQYLIVLPLEIIAGAFTTNYWNPEASKSIFIVLFFLLILGINLLGVKGYGEAEFIFSAVKITAVMGFMYVTLPLAQWRFLTVHKSSRYNYQHSR